jgi:hydroxyethylthiazole kinase-like uncharacterized protein yjeF
MSETRLACYRAKDVRELDRLAIAGGIPGFELMQRAARAAFRALQAQWPQARHCIVCCGSGNNGGDGFVLAALARQAGLDVCIVLAGDQAAIKGDARLAFALALEQRVPVVPATEFAGFAHYSRRDAVIVDALLGTGLTGPARGAQALLIDRINASGLPVLTLDIPSGLDSDSGTAAGNVVKADLTVSFIACKLGLRQRLGPALCGRLLLDTLDVPAAVFSEVPPTAWL